MIDHTQTELRVMAIFLMLGAVFSFLLGGMDNLIIALLVLIALDYSIGLLAAWQTCTLDSKKGFDGIKRKVVMLVMVVVANQIDIVLGNSHTLRTMIIFAYIGNEGLSIIENIDRMGYGDYVPQFIREKLIQLRCEKEVKSNDKK